MYSVQLQVIHQVTFQKKNCRQCNIYLFFNIYLEYSTFALCTASMSTILSTCSPGNFRELRLIIFSSPAEGKLSGTAIAIGHSSREGYTDKSKGKKLIQKITFEELKISYKLKEA